jgi:hypothetical protein
LVRRAAIFLAVVIIILCAVGPLWAAADSDSPLTIIRATFTEDEAWDVHRFILLPDGGPPGSIEPIPQAVDIYCSVIEYTLFRARYLAGFEGALRDGIAGEFERRERIKRASFLGIYLYCPPFWPAHLLWELPISGAEKERMLDKEGMTIPFPQLVSGGMGEIPGVVEDGMKLRFDGPQADGRWLGAGLHLSYRTAGDLSVGRLFPGWPDVESGTILLLLDVPPDIGVRIRSGDNGRDILAALWPGRYEWAMGRAVAVFSSDRFYVGCRQIKSRNGMGVHVQAIDADSALHVRDGALPPVLRNPWPGKGAMLDRNPVLVLIGPGFILLLIIFHGLNLLIMKINYSSEPSGALFEPAIAQLCILAMATIFAPFLGLGWIVGAYAAGRFIAWRHPAVRKPWLAMVLYAFIAATAYEAIFAGVLWI